MVFVIFGIIFTHLVSPQPVHAEAGWKIVGGSDTNDPQRCIFSANNADFENIYSSQEACQAGLTNLQNTDFTPGSGNGGGGDIPCNPECSIGGIITFDTSDSGGGTVTKILQLSIATAAVIAFIFAGFGAVRIVTSAGNPGGITAGREMIISAISGLLFIVFAVTILEIIGANILGLPAIESTPDLFAP